MLSLKEEDYLSAILDQNSHMHSQCVSGSLILCQEPGKEARGCVHVPEVALCKTIISMLQHVCGSFIGFSIANLVCCVKKGSCM